MIEIDVQFINILVVVEVYGHFQYKSISVESSKFKIMGANLQSIDLQLTDLTGIQLMN
jgi:hypothetical protein